MKAFALVLALFAFGCAAARPAPEPPPPYRFTSGGTVIFGEEFEFSPPAPEWKVVRVAEGEDPGEFQFAFLRVEPGPSPSQSIFAYDEEPFGYSRDLAVRAKEHLKRFLWGAILRFRTIEEKPVRVLDGDGLAVVVEGRDEVKREKVRAKVVFARRGERVVSFYITQWRPIDAEYDPSAFAAFDDFVRSFRFTKKSFYETL